MTVIGEGRSLPFAAWCFVEIDDFKLCASSSGGHANHVLFPLGARLQFDTTAVLIVVALELRWNCGDGFPVAALQHSPVLRELLAIKRENLFRRVGGYVVLQVQTRALFLSQEIGRAHV